MAYIAPNSDIVLLQNIKLDSAYENTIYFASKSAQESYFFNQSKIVTHLTNHMYNRTMKNVIKVKLSVGTVEHCTYMAFKNTSYENKWFYCFIDDFNYINDNTTEIIYHIDEVQTYFIGECTPMQCYVLREHAMDDTVGANRVPEPIGSDHYRYNLKWECPDMNEYSVVISASSTTGTGQVSGDALQQGMFNGLQVQYIPITDGTDADYIRNELDDMLGDGNYIDPDSQYTDRQQVVSLIMFPSTFCGDDTLSVEPYSAPYTKHYGAFPKARTNIDGYTPKNNKLLTAPFKSLLLTNGIGGAVTLDYDDFMIDQITFMMWGVCSGSGELVCVPENYKQQTGIIDDYKLTINGFPQCAYTLDSYRAWVAGGGQKYQQLGLIQGIAQGLFSSIRGGMSMLRTNEQTGNAYEDAMNTIEAGSSINPTVKAFTNAERVSRMNSINNASSFSGLGSTILNTGINYMSTKYETGNMVNVPVGSPTASALVANRELNFRCYELNIIAQDAQRIDDFFSMYGYATNKIKVPNINGRPQWNYVKTQDCVISGNVPSNIRTHIAQLFDRGIRFWNNGDNIGNYSLTNK